MGTVISHYWQFLVNNVMAHAQEGVLPLVLGALLLVEPVGEEDLAQDAATLHLRHEGPVVECIIK